MFIKIQKNYIEMNDIGVFGDKWYSLDLLGKEYSLEYWWLFWIDLGKEYSLDLLGKEYSLEYWKLILNRFGKRIFFRILDSYFEKIWEKNIL